MADTEKARHQESALRQLRPPFPVDTEPTTLMTGFLCWFGFATMPALHSTGLGHFLFSCVYIVILKDMKVNSERYEYITS